MSILSPETLLKAVIVENQVTPPFILSPNTYQLSTHCAQPWPDRNCRNGWDTADKSGILNSLTCNDLWNPKWTPSLAKGSEADREVQGVAISSGAENLAMAQWRDIHPLDSSSSSHLCVLP